MIGIVDYGMGNLLSVFNALEMLGAEAAICTHPQDLQEAERIILPGVGAFRDCMTNLINQGFVDVLNTLVLQEGRPILGICLGMQAMARRSFEGGDYQGLGWFEADVVRLQPADPALRVPQVGWNDVTYSAENPLFAALPTHPDFYFVHSFHLQCDRPQDVAATCDYGGPVTAAVQRDNLCATQFHPEKSQNHGLKVLENFVQWRP